VRKVQIRISILEYHMCHAFSDLRRPAASLAVASKLLPLANCLRKPLASHSVASNRECVLFIGTQFSNLYTSVYCFRKQLGAIGSETLSLSEALWKRPEAIQLLPDNVYSAFHL
jgi:hypothetical protein